MCSVETICNAQPGDGLEYKVDTSYEYYINNWYVNMPGLICMPGA